jgi:hypothetical protein
MAPHRRSAACLCPWSVAGKFLRVAMFCSLVSTLAGAKDAPLTAIELFDGGNGAAYVQLTDLLINGKEEVRSCDPAVAIDKSAYGKLPKVPLAGATSLERNSQGVLMLVRGSESTCVVPANLKVENDWGKGASDLAEHAVLQGKVLSSSVAGIDSPPPLKIGVRIVFVSEPDTELAEYLRAERANSTANWVDYLARYPKSSHAAAAKQFLALLLDQEGQESLTVYRKTGSSSTPNYAELKKARLQVEQAKDLVPTDARALQLTAEIQSELKILTDRSRTEFQAYQNALAEHTAGYKHLADSRQLLGHVLEVDPNFDQAQSLETSVAKETSAIESSIQKAQSLDGAQRFDEALAAVAPYRTFSDEEPRIAAIVNVAYKYHFERAKGFENEQRWQEAVQEYQRACDIMSTEDCLASLKKAQANLQITKNRAITAAALQKSEEFEAEKNYVDAYEVLADLPDAQRALVTDRMQSLEPAYIKAASQQAKRLQEAHTPIRGKADEVGVQKAYEYLSRASTLADDQNLRLRLDLLSDIISDYYMRQAKRYLEKPQGSGVGVAWLYLDEAQLYKPNQNDVHDERAKSSSVHDLRSRLSIRLVFHDQTRDQTSRSAGFADQLSNAVATGLETSGKSVKVVRSTDNTTVEPNFELIGDVVDHRVVVNTRVEPMESKYRIGVREIPNDEWNKANQDYAAALADLQTAQKLKKKDGSQQVDDAEKKVHEAQLKLDSIPKTTPSDVIKPYSYTKKTYDLSGEVKLLFRIVDAGGNTIDQTTTIDRPAQKSVVVFENVKPDDTEGVKVQGSPPDAMQYLTDLEIDARDALIKAVKEKVEGLPTQILAQARQRVSDGDLDGAAEAYILYLNSTPDAVSDRLEAKRFLQEQFNMTKIASSAP